MQDRQIPCHLIAGTLGVGKTTAILDYLKRHAGKQFVAVLVNDFGPVGIDGAIMEGELAGSGDSEIKISMVPGGCICCTALPGMINALKEIGTADHVDRAIIEPSGLARASAIIDIVRSMQDEVFLDLRPVITLLDPRDLDRPKFMDMPFFTHLVDAADVLVANKCDQTTPEQIEKFEQLADRLYPPKIKVVRTEFGKLPDELFEMKLTKAAPTSLRAVQAAAEGHHAHEHEDHDHGDASRAGGLMMESDVKFDYRKVKAWVQRLAADGFEGQVLERFKAVLNTNSGWYLFEVAGGDSHQRPSQYRRDNRLDWIAENGQVADEKLKAALMATQVEP